MIWLSFDHWSRRADSMFTYDRVYRNGYKWTPFVEIKRRYKQSGV
jgi:hypothetical protein